MKFQMLTNVAALLLVNGVASLANAANDGVSRVGGQVVPVGERTHYVLDYDRWNISTNPLGYMYGDFSLGVSYAVSDNIALRVDGELQAPYSASFVGAGVAVGAPIYFRKMYDGFYLEPGFAAAGGKDGDTGATALLYGPRMLVGWHWMWDSGFNISAAMGISQTWAKSSAEDVEFWHQGAMPAGYLRFGKSF